MAQTVLAEDDGTDLKEIIIFGRHSIRAPTSDAANINQYAADPYPAFIDPGSGEVSKGILTLRGKQAAELLGAYFRKYLLHEGLLTGTTNDLARTYFRANIIERSYMTAARFGAGLIPNVTIPVHTYTPGPTNADPVFDPLWAGVATVDPALALAEVQELFVSGTNITSLYSNELSLIRKALYPSGTQPAGAAPQQGSVDPTSLPIAIVTNNPMSPPLPPYFTGDVVDLGGLDIIVNAADPFIMQYANGFPTNDVAWGRLTSDEVSQQTRINTLQIQVTMRMPYIAKVQSSSAASHILRTLLQTVNGETLGGAFGDATTQIHVITSSDFYVAGLAGLLNAHWQLPGYQPDFCAPAGALVFELRQVRTTEEYRVRVFYTAQTLDQLRNLTPLDLENPPATEQLRLDGNLDMSFSSFSNLMSNAIGMEYVPSFDTVPPDVIDNPYLTTNPANITISVSNETLSIAWPSDHLGWVLQATTNGLISPEWFNLPGTVDLTTTPVPIDPALSAVFYRLLRP